MCRRSSALESSLKGALSLYMERDSASSLLERNGFLF